MLLVVIAVAVTTILSMSFLVSQSTSHGVAQNVQMHAQARSVAESALVAAIHYVQNDDDVRSAKSEGQWVSNASLNGGTFDLYAYDGIDTDGDGTVDDTDGDLGDDDSDPITITAIGYFNGVSHTVHAVVTPGGSGFSQTVLMVVDDDDSLAASESQRRDLMEGWGWEVNVIRDSASPSAYSTALEDADVVLVTDTVSAGSVGTKLKGASHGIVIEEPGLLDDFGVSSSYTTYDNVAVSVTNSNHYVTSGFGMGQLVVSTESASMGRPSGSMATDATTIAQVPGSGSPAITVLETGGALYGGGIASGRRVSLPTGGFPVDDLTDDGKQLIKQAMTWAGGGDADNFLAGQWTFDEGSGLTAYDSSGNGQNGPITSGSPATEWTDGKVFGGLRFDGSGDGFVRIPDSDELDLTDEGTLSAWIYLDGYKNFMGIIHKGEFRDWSDEAYSLQFWTGRKLALTFTTTTGAKKLIGSKKLQNDRWYHVAGTWGPNGMALYVDGELDRSNSVAAVGVPSIGSVQIGSQLSEFYNSSYKNLPFIGVIDDARIYRRTLTAAEIKDQYDQAIASDDMPQLIALYEFEEVVPDPPATVGQWKLDDAGSSGSSSSATGFAFGDRIYMYNNTKVDSYSSSDGAYGGANITANAQVSTNATNNGRVRMYSNATVHGDFDVGPGGNPSSVMWMYGSSSVTGSTGSLSEDVVFPSLSAPSGMPSSSGNVTYNSGSVTYNADRTVNNLTLNNGSIINISGDVRLHVRNNLTLNDGQIILQPGASLELYVNRNTVLNNGSAINPDSSRASSLTMYSYHTSSDLTLNEGSIAGTIYVSDDLTMHNSSEIFGAIHIKDDVTLSGNAAIHLDAGGGGGGALTVVDEAGLSDGSASGTIAGGSTGNGDGGTAFEFDGTDGYVEIPHHADYLLNNGAVSFWFKPDSLSGYRGLFSKDSQNNDTGGHLHIYTQGSTLKARLQSTSDSYTVQASGLSVGNWYHVVVSFGSAGLKLYRNGDLVDSDSYTGGIGSNSGGIGNHEPIVLGANTWSSDDLQATPLQDYFSGLIDEVRLYDQGLDEGQVAEVYAHGDPSAGPASVVYDTSGFGAPLNLDIEDPDRVSWSYSGLTLDSATRVISPTPALKLYNALTATDQVSFEAVFTPADATQSGPAIIAAYSGSGSSCNMVLGQDMDLVVSRLRTSTTTNNGLPAAETDPLLIQDTQTHVIVSYDGENITVYRSDGSATTLERTGEFNWDNSFRFMLGDEATGGRSWLGTLSRIAIYDKAFNAAQAANVFAGGEPGSGSAAGPGSVNWVEP